MKKQILITVTFIFCLVSAMAQKGSITNIRVSQGTGDEVRLIDILFYLTGNDPFYDITLEVSFDNGASYTAIDNSNVTGALIVAPGSDIHLVWDGRVNYSTQNANFSLIKITATTSTCGDDFVDTRDSKSYSTVPIGSQCWMKENLNYDQSSYGNDWCYNDDPNYCDLYGRLYDWAAVMQVSSSSNSIPSGVQGVCPAGWHVPSDAEWTVLTDFLGGELVAGTHMKSISGWNSNGNGDNSSGFTALPGGYRSLNFGTFSNAGFRGYWWSATENSSYDAWYRSLYYNNAYVYRYDSNKSYGFSVRCIRDE